KHNFLQPIMKSHITADRMQSNNASSDDTHWVRTDLFAWLNVSHEQPTAKNCRRRFHTNTHLHISRENFNKTTRMHTQQSIVLGKNVECKNTKLPVMVGVSPSIPGRSPSD
ncbi:unnamed protein product, partial [Ceratitis capitata]